MFPSALSCVVLWYHTVKNPSSVYSKASSVPLVPAELEAAQGAVGAFFSTDCGPGFLEWEQGESGLPSCLVGCSVATKTIDPQVETLASFFEMHFCVCVWILQGPHHAFPRHGRHSLTDRV